MKLLVVSSMFPTPAQPLHALFVRSRVNATAGRADVLVVNPVPYFPLATAMKRYAHRRATPATSQQEALKVLHPRHLSIPGLLKPLDAPFLGAAVRSSLRRTGFSPDAIEAHMAFPDGAGVLGLARQLAVPLGVTLRGVDVNEIPDRYPFRARQVRRCLRLADVLFPVSRSLGQRAEELGADPAKIVTVHNGVDGCVFRPRPQAEARERCRLPLGPRIVLSVGHMGPRKRFDVLIEALALIPPTNPRPLLVLAGGAGAEGDVRPALRRRVASLGLGDRVVLPGPLPPEELAWWYAAADVFGLASLLEGRPNAALEALAVGIPVVAANVWGLPELVPDERFGILLDQPTPTGFSRALADALDRSWDRQAISAFGSSFTWEASATTIVAHLERLVRERGGAA